MRNWLKAFLPLFLETLPLFGLIFIINPVLIAFIPREPFEYKWSFVILSIAGVCLAALTAFFISFFSNKYRQIAIAIFRSLFVIFFVVSIFYPESGRQLDGGISEDFSWFYYFIIYSIYIISFFVLMALFVRKNFVIRNV
jgi:ABC-type branched-subunit amino acid transport system permease subunit